MSIPTKTGFQLTPQALPLFQDEIVFISRTEIDDIKDYFITDDRVKY